MALQRISSLKKYAQVLKQSPEEAQALAEDIFIHVTGFFRDPECFEALKKTVLPKLRRKGVAADDPIRIWVAGCSTGEEVYSIAMLLLEDLGERANRTRIQMFGSDIQESSIQPEVPLQAGGDGVVRNRRGARMVVGNTRAPTY
jgi:two-component system CheB/CheR fusion protein